jgi:hypothetical protein
MYRCIAAGIILLPTTLAFSGQKPQPQRSASVKLWLDTNTANPCEQAAPASGAWIIRNNEERNVLVKVHRVMTREERTREDDVRDTLGPRESRDLGCEVSEDGRQAMTLLKAVY